MDLLGPSTHKLIDGLHGWVGFGFHSVQDGPTSFLYIIKMSISEWKSIRWKPQ